VQLGRKSEAGASMKPRIGRFFIRGYGWVWAVWVSYPKANPNVPLLPHAVSRDLQGLKRASCWKHPKLWVVK